MGRFSNPFCFIATLLLAIIAVSSVAAQQGQYHIKKAPSNIPGLPDRSGIATYSPLKAIDGSTIQLKEEDGIVYSFTLDAGTIFCQGETKVSDWSFLKKSGKRIITVLTQDEEHKNALIIWNLPPKISMVNGNIHFDLPPMCQ
jgi:hypothetical protein